MRDILSTIHGYAIFAPWGDIDLGEGLWEPSEDGLHKANAICWQLNNDRGIEEGEYSVVEIHHRPLGGKENAS